MRKILKKKLCVSFHGNGGHFGFYSTGQGTLNFKTVSSNAVKTTKIRGRCLLTSRTIVHTGSMWNVGYNNKKIDGNVSTFNRKPVFALFTLGRFRTSRAEARRSHGIGVYISFRCLIVCICLCIVYKTMLFCSIVWTSGIAYVVYFQVRL